MSALSFAMVKRPVANELAVSVSDSRVIDAVNEAQDRLIKLGKWKGCYQRYRFCVNNGCITLPREVDTIEAFAVESMPGTVRSEWFEFLESGPGLVGPNDDVGVQLLDRGEACAFDDVRGENKVLAVYCDVTETAGTGIVLRFWNNLGQKARTQQGGQFQDGEKVLFAAAGQYAYTTNQCAAGGFVAAIKPRTNGTVRIYEYDTVTLALRPLAYYEATEEVPRYRRALIPSLRSLGGEQGCENTTVDVMVKLAHIPVVGHDNDLLVIQSRGAIKLAAKAIKHEASNDFQGAAQWWAAATATLDQELRSHLGDGTVHPVRTPPREVYGAAVENII